MAITTLANLATVIPDIVEAVAIATASRKMVFMPHMVRLDRTGPGDIFHHTQRVALSFAAYASDGTAPTPTTYAPGERTHQPVERTIDVEIGRKGIADSVVDLSSDIGAEVGIAYAKDTDARIAAIYTEAPAASPDHEIGTDAVPFSTQIIVDGEVLLMTQQAPRPDGGPSKKGFIFVVGVPQYGELCQDDSFKNASIWGAPTVITEGVRDDGWVRDYMNTSVYQSDQIIESSGLHAMHFSRQNALGWTFKRIGRPGGPLSEIMIDLAWNEAKRSYSTHATYEAIAGGMKGTSATTNNWLVDAIS